MHCTNIIIYLKHENSKGIVNTGEINNILMHWYGAKNIVSQNFEPPPKDLEANILLSINFGCISYHLLVNYNISLTVICVYWLL